LDYQKHIGRLIYDQSVFDIIDPQAKLHLEIKDNPSNSAYSFLNVLCSLINEPEELKRFLNHFGL